MAFAQAVGISLAFGDRDILKDVNINLSAESRIGLSGANGSGKSTLMKIIAGIMKPDTGTVSVPKGVRISYLPQSGLVHEGSNLKSEAEKAFDFYRDKIREKEEIASRLARLGEGSPETQELLLAPHELEEFVRGSRTAKAKRRCGFRSAPTWIRSGRTSRMASCATPRWAWRFTRSKM